VAFLYSSLIFFIYWVTFASLIVLKTSNPTVEFYEKELLKGLAQNDRKAIEIIYTNHYPIIQALIISNNGTYDDAKDIFQEGMIILYENAKREDFILTSQLKTYLYAICKRLWLKQLQQKQRYTTGWANNEDQSIIVNEALEIHEKQNATFELMDEALNTIGNPCKQLLEAYYIEKKNMDEIAKSFGYTNADNAKNQKYKCLMRLKKIFFTKYNK